MSTNTAQLDEELKSLGLSGLDEALFLSDASISEETIGDAVFGDGDGNDRSDLGEGDDEDLDDHPIDVIRRAVEAIWDGEALSAGMAEALEKIDFSEVPKAVSEVLADSLKEGKIEESDTGLAESFRRILKKIDEGIAARQEDLDDELDEGVTIGFRAGRRVRRAKKGFHMKDGRVVRVKPAERRKRRIRDRRRRVKIKRARMHRMRKAAAKRKAARTKMARKRAGLEHVSLADRLDAVLSEDAATSSKFGPTVERIATIVDMLGAYLGAKRVQESLKRGFDAFRTQIHEGMSEKEFVSAARPVLRQIVQCVEAIENRRESKRRYEDDLPLV